MAEQVLDNKHLIDSNFSSSEIGTDVVAEKVLWDASGWPASVYHYQITISTIDLKLLSRTAWPSGSAARLLEISRMS